MSEDWGQVVANQQDWPEEYIVPDVSAPGSETVTASANGGYRTFSGTSAAGPHVAATAALMQSASEEDLQPAEIEEALRSTAYYPDIEDTQDTRLGHGYTISTEAVNRVAERKPTIVINDTRYVGANPTTEVERENIIRPDGGHSSHKFEFDVKNIGQYGETRDITWEFNTAVNKTGLNGTELAEAHINHGSTLIDAQTARVQLNPGKETTIRTSLAKEYLNDESTASVEAVNWEIRDTDRVAWNPILENKTDTDREFHHSLNNPEISDEPPADNIQENTTKPPTNTSQESENSSTDGTPGFGISTGLLSLAGVTYLLRRNN